MSLVVKEKGLPVEVALRLAASQGLLSKARLDELRKELYDIVEEVTVKFVGFFAAKSVKKGLDVALRFVSLYLEFETKGSYQPDVWISRINALGFKGVSKKTIELFQELVSLPNQDTLQPDHPVLQEEIFKSTVRKEIITCFTVEHGQSGYEWYRSNLASRIENKLHVEFVDWFLQKRTGRNLRYWSENLEFMEEGNTPESSGVINSMLLRETLGLVPRPYLTYDEAKAAQAALKTRGSKWTAKARQRFDLFMEIVPKKFRGLYILEGWFEKKFVTAKPRFFDRGGGEQALFHIIAVPIKVQDRMMKEDDWRNDVPKDKRAAGSPDS